MANDERVDYFKVYYEGDEVPPEEQKTDEPSDRPATEEADPDGV